MSRFSTPEKVWAYAMKAAAGDYRRHIDFGVDFNPFCTAGARNDWQRGFDNAGPRSYESPDIVLWDTIYLRGRAAAEIIKGKKS